jgi:23S rRNA pseudouridine2457 synthase
MLIAFYKPFDVLSQFTQELPTHRTLAEFGFPPAVYGIGRLDRDSEGLLLLSDEPRWTARLMDPQHGHERTYWAQVEGLMPEVALAKLRAGVVMKDYRAQPCKAKLVTESDPAVCLPPRDPPIRQRLSVPTSWVELTLREGKNRQVRKMTAAVGHPTLRLVRVRIGGLNLLELGLAPGGWKQLSVVEEKQMLSR